MTGRRPRLLLRRGGIAIASLICAVGVSTPTSGASARFAHAARCAVGTRGPVIRFPTIYAFGRFCSPTARAAPASVVLLGRIGGKWTRITGVSKQLHMLPGKTYVVKTPAIHCTAHPHSIRMRTYVALRTGPGRGQTYALTNSGIPTYCI